MYKGVGGSFYSKPPTHSGRSGYPRWKKGRVHCLKHRGVVFFHRGRVCWWREENTPGRTRKPTTKEERAHRQGTQARPKKKDVLGLYIGSHLYTLYPKHKFTSEFSLTPLKKIVMNKGIFFALLGSVLTCMSLFSMLTVNSVNEGIGSLFASILSFIVFGLGVMEINNANK
jgi:hypothetical protein